MIRNGIERRRGETLPRRLLPSLAARHRAKFHQTNLFVSKIHIHRKVQNAASQKSRQRRD